MTSLLDQMDVYVLPVFNIDGYEYSHTTVFNFRFKPNLIIQLLYLIFKILSSFWNLTEQNVEKDPLQVIWKQLPGHRSQQEL